MANQQPFNQTQRIYPRLPPDTHPAVVQAFNDLHDHVFSLRDQVQKMQSGATKQVASPEKKPFTLDIAGIKVNAPTDSSSLQSGMTVRYNASTGTFDFGI